jgi:hypothetical protein
MEEQRGTRADENGDVAERRVEFYHRAPAGGGAALHDGVGVPVTPDDPSAARKETCFSRDEGVNGKGVCARTARERGSPETEVTFGVRTGVTKMSLPTMNWRSTESSSGSCGNSKKSARTGGVPYREAFAKSVY